MLYKSNNNQNFRNTHKPQHSSFNIHDCKWFRSYTIIANDMHYVCMSTIFAKDMQYICMSTIFAKDMHYICMSTIFAKDMLYICMSTLLLLNRALYNKSHWFAIYIWKCIFKALYIDSIHRLTWNCLIYWPLQYYIYLLIKRIIVIRCIAGQSMNRVNV